MAEKSVIRELVTLLGFDIDEKEIKEYEKRVDRIKTNLRRMAIAAGIAAGALTAVVVRTTRLGNDIAKTSKRLGLGVEQLQKYRFAFSQANVSTQTFDMAVQRAGRRLAEAAKGTGEAVKAVAELGITLKDGNGNLRDLDALLMDAFDALSLVENQTDRNRLAMKLFDSEGVRLVQGLDKGNVALKSNMALFESLGAVIDEDTAKAAEGLADEWGLLTATLNGFIIMAGKELIPIVTDILVALRKWLAENRKLITVIGTVVLGILAFTAVVSGAIAITVLWNLKLLILNTTVGALLIKVLAIPLAIGAAVAALAILAEDIDIGLSGTGDSVLGRFLKSLPALWYLLKQGFFGFMDAIWERLKVIRAWIFEIPAKLSQEFTAFIDRQEARIEALRNKILGITPGVTVPNVGGIDPALNNLDAMMRSAAAGIGPPAETSRGDTNVTVYAAPGETPEAIAGAVARKLTGADITSSLTGLSR